MLPPTFSKQFPDMLQTFFGNISEKVSHDIFYFGDFLRPLAQPYRLLQSATRRVAPEFAFQRIPSPLWTLGEFDSFGRTSQR